MSKFYMLVGLPGSGKSYIAQELMEKNTNIQLFSSDKLREELWGDESIQGDNNKLFTELHNRIKKCLSNGNDCIYDATNISAKRRMAFLNSISKYKVYKTCIFVLTSIEKCKENNEKRNRKVPNEVIENMYLKLEIPQYREGWDKIEIERRFDKYIDFRKDMDNLRKIPHDNPHYSLSIGDHMCFCASHVLNNYALKIKEKELNYIFKAAFFHDIGKPFTKQFKDIHGNETKIAHYYYHEKVSAYLYLLKYCKAEELVNDKLNDSLFVSDLIQLHMIKFTAKTEKSINKLIKLIGNEKYKLLNILNEVDNLCR